MTAALEGGEWSAARPGRSLPPGKTRCSLYRRLGGPQGRSGRAENLVPNGIRSRTVQPVVSRYTDWATGPIYICGTAVAQWLRCCATNRKVAVSIPAGVIGIFHWHNPSDRTMALGSTQPLTDMSTRSSCGKGGRCVRLTTYHHPVPLSRNLGAVTS